MKLYSDEPTEIAKLRTLASEIEIGDDNKINKLLDLAFIVSMSKNEELRKDSVQSKKHLFCARCGENAEDGAFFCRYCGAELNPL